MNGNNHHLCKSGIGFVSDQSVKLFLIEHTIIVEITSFHDLLDFFLGNTLAHLLDDPSQTLNADISSLVIVKQGEQFTNFLSGIVIGNSGRHQVNVLLKIDMACSLTIHVANQLVDCVTLGSVSKCLQRGFEICIKFKSTFSIDIASLFLVKSIERLFNVKDLFLSQACPGIHFRIKSPGSRS